MKEYLAHISPDGERVQTVADHLSGTARLAAEFSKEFDSESFGYLAGIAHDIGKYSEGFQKRLEGGPIVDHSTAGALECAAIGQELVGLCIAGHHGGIPDFGNQNADAAGDDTFVGRIKKAISTRRTAYPGWTAALPQTPPPPSFDGDCFVQSFWGRMLYSCLVDADFLDTEAFMRGGKVDRGGYDGVDELLNKLNDYTSKWSNASNELNRIRNSIREDCIKAGNEKPGLFTLTVPTGGGKTVSSLSFALEHAKKNGLKRIIYIIPYTSIIEQNAAVFRDILGDNNVVEHHSEAAFLYDEHLTETQKRIAFASENWDSPVIVTTAVQFFESLYSNKPSKCRKLHNIANSVLIFDEAQNIPVGHLLPCLAAIGILVKHFGSSAVLCSATQPYVTDLLNKYAEGLPIREICGDVSDKFDKLKRVKYRTIGKRSVEEMAAEISGRTQTLCIVNTRKTAKTLYDLLPSEGSYHLSTLMTPQHRKAVLSEIKKRLKQGEICRVVSTSLIEAGVDIDFPSVYREMTGIDSIIQAAGRCNIEGKRDLSQSVVTVFELDENPPPMIRINIGASREAGCTAESLERLSVIERYFRSYRELIGRESIDRSNAVKNMNDGISGCLLPYKTVSERFHLIDQNTKTVYIPTQENRDLIEKIKDGSASKKDYRKAGAYSVNIYEKHFESLLSAGDIEETASGAAILRNGDLYSEKTGLSLNADYGKSEFV